MAKKKVSGASRGMEGAIVGAVLGVAAGLFLNSKKGKDLRKDVKQQTADFYKSVAPKVKKIKEMKEAEFKAFMEKNIVQYGKTKKMTEAEVKDLMSEVKGSWKQITKHF